MLKLNQGFILKLSRSYKDKHYTTILTKEVCCVKQNTFNTLRESKNLLNCARLETLPYYRSSATKLDIMYLMHVFP